MPVIQCDIREGRTEEEKQALAQEITRVVHETIGAPVEYIYVLSRQTPGSHHVKARAWGLSSRRRLRAGRRFLKPRAGIGAL